MITQTLTLELGEEDPPNKCQCCGKKSRSVHGFAYRNGDAYAVYYAGWAEGHPERGVTMAIATGEWGDDSDVADRVSIGIEAKTSESRIQFTVLDPEQSPWGRTELLGELLQRQVALQHSQLKQFFELAESVVREDVRVKTFLAQPGQVPALS
jgi:hypothetical protein